MKECYTLKMPTGTISIADLTFMPPEGWAINRINVPRQYRSQGYGTKLLKTILRDADIEGVTLYLVISPSDGLNYTQLNKWYKKYGFERIHSPFHSHQRKPEDMALCVGGPWAGQLRPMQSKEPYDRLFLIVDDPNTPLPKLDRVYFFSFGKVQSFYRLQKLRTDDNKLYRIWAYRDEITLEEALQVLSTSPHLKRVELKD